MSSRQGSPFVDQARRLVCRVLARTIESGSMALRIRLEQSAGEPVHAWFYAHSEAGWEKQPDDVTDHGLLEAILEEMDLLTSKGHGDEWSCRDHTSGTHRDLDLHVHPEKFQGQDLKSLESAVMGLLFRDGHDSKKDVRRRIRTQH